MAKNKKTVKTVSEVDAVVEELKAAVVAQGEAKRALAAVTADYNKVASDYNKASQSKNQVYENWCRAQDATNQAFSKLLALTNRPA